MDVRAINQAPLLVMGRIIQEPVSIHSSALMWQAVVLAHYRALEDAHSDSHAGHKYYTTYLSKHAKDLVEDIFDIHDWIQGSLETQKPSQEFLDQIQFNH